MSAQTTMLWHLSELQALKGRLGDGHVAHERIAARIQECKDVLKTLDKTPKPL
jgi:hypothetical protein